MIKENLEYILSTIPKSVTLVAVSKTKPESAIEAAYVAGQRIFGENKVQELVTKFEKLPKDIEWHMIGHLQSNKVKYIAPFISLIHGVDSEKLLKEINKQGAKSVKKINVLLQFHIAEEETKFGFSIEEVLNLLESDSFRKLTNVNICGVMGMASNTSDQRQVREEFAQLKKYFDLLKKDYFQTNQEFKTISMGMSSDYEIAIQQGSNMVRVGSSIFGERA